MSTTTYAVTMAELKEPAHNNMWYGSPVQMSAGRTSHHGVDSLAMAGAAAAAAANTTRPRTEWSSMDHHQPPPSHYPAYPPRYAHETSDPYDSRNYSHAAMGAQQYGTKRSYSATEQAPYGEMVQDLRGDESKMGVGSDHKLLSFRKAQDKHAIVDQHGRMQQLELNALLHGMFFLSEMPTNSGEGMLTQPELTCYRRNLFQISGSLVTPRGQLSVVLETGETVPVQSTEVTISAIESVDNHPVRLIVIPWKTPPPNSPEINQGPDQEPPPLPLIPFTDEGNETEGEFAVYPIGWRRLQFRIATANNGRRKELQQHFTLHLKVMGTLTNGSKVVLTEATTAPVVVRGRSPRNFQARKEIPLLGSSAGSRGQALVETGLGIVAGPLQAKPQEMKGRPMNMEMPRSAFSFNAAPKMPPSPLGSMRSNSYPNTAWNPSLSHMSSTGSGGYPSTTLSGDPYHNKLPLSGAAGYTAEPTEMGAMPSMQLAMASSDPHAAHQPHAAQLSSLRTSAYPTYATGGPTATQQQAATVPRYVDDDSQRPAKSARRQSTNQSADSGDFRYAGAAQAYATPVHSGSAASATGMSPSASQQQGASGAGQAAPANTQGAAPAYPSTNAWAPAGGDAASVPAYTNGDQRSTAYNTYTAGAAVAAADAKPEAQASQPAYPGGMNNYSWSAT